jgi:hypothetical protein
MTKGQNPSRPSRQKASRAIPNSGLIAKAQTRKRSVGTKSALDDRSHRTNAEADECRLHRFVAPVAIAD